MIDLPLDEIIEEGHSSEELENRFGFRTISRGPIISATYLAWLHSKDKSDIEEDSPRVDSKRFQENFDRALKQHSPDMIYRVFQLFVNKSQLNTDDPLFTDLQLYLKEHGINTVLLPYVAQEGHA